MDVTSCYVATTQNGTAQKVYFDPVGSYVSALYAPITCTAQAAAAAGGSSAAYSTLSCVGGMSTTGNQTISAVCYAANTGNGANGKLFLASSLTTVANGCESVVLNMVPYVAPVT